MPTISFGGVASGLDTQAIVTQLMALRRRPITQLETQKTELKQGIAALTDLESALSRLETAAKALDTESEFASKAATSSDEGVFTADASAVAALGNFRVIVDSLAQTHREVSQVFSDPTDVVGTGDVTITQGGETFTVTLADGANTLVDLKEAINASDAGVNATIMNDGTGYRLLLSASESGADAAFTSDLTGLGGGTAPTMTTSSTGANASLSIDGIAITSADNVVEGALEGVTLRLQEAGTAELNVEGDQGDLEGKLNEFVSAYNAVADAIKDQSAMGATLNGSTIVRTVQSRLSSIMTGAVDTGGDVRIAAEVGLTLDRDGQLSLDTEKLREAIESDPQAVNNLFVKTTETEGIAAAMGRTIGDLTSTADGIFKIRKDGMNDEIEAIDDRIAREERSLEIYEELLNRKFTAMEVAISRLQQQSGFLGL